MFIMIIIVFAQVFAQENQIRKKEEAEKSAEFSLHTASVV